MNDQSYKEAIKELVLARLQILPPDLSISIGSQGSFTRDEMIDHVDEEDELGKLITEIELDYLKTFKEGTLYE